MLRKRCRSDRTARGQMAAVMRYGCRRGSNLRRVCAVQLRARSGVPFGELTTGLADRRSDRKVRVAVGRKTQRTPCPVPICKMIGSAVRSKPLRWRETTRTERDSMVATSSDGASAPGVDHRRRSEEGPYEGRSSREAGPCVPAVGARRAPTLEQAARYNRERRTRKSRREAARRIPRKRARRRPDQEDLEAGLETINGKEGAAKAKRAATDRGRRGHPRATSNAS